MVTDAKVTLVGVEQASLYKQNADVFKELIDKKSSIRFELSALAQVLANLRQKIYSSELNELVGKEILHRQGQVQFTEYWDHFSRLAKKHGVDYRQYDELKKLADTIELEKDIDFEQASVERDALIAELNQKLDKNQLERLVLLSLKFKQSKISAGEFHSELASLAAQGGVLPVPYKNIILYARYVSV
jgi:hypothetical protein